MGLLGVWYAAVLAEASSELQEALEEARVVLLALVPFAFLAGLLRSRVAGATAVSELVTRLGDPSDRRHGLRDALADALGDRSLMLAYWLPERGEYVDSDGRPFELPGPGSGRTCTAVESNGDRVAVIVHDAALENERELVRTVGAAASLTLENERLDAELRAKVEELRVSRVRIVDSGDAARRRLERDLHDGAQQRLVSLALGLAMLQPRVESDPEAMRELDLARSELDQALEELRELARGIHPSVLSDQGIDAALQGLASRANVPVELEICGGDRLPERVEAAAYFVVAEALTNVAQVLTGDARKSSKSRGRRAGAGRDRRRRGRRRRPREGVGPARARGPRRGARGSVRDRLAAGRRHDRDRDDSVPVAARRPTGRRPAAISGCEGSSQCERRP